ncbi:MAG: SDR family oxidoreductase, partial [Myxococcota bacterium]
MVTLITGASGGVGRVLASTLATHGMTVYGTMRDPSQADADLPFRMLPMEVTDAASVDRCVQEVLDREGRIDVLINCVNQMIIGGFDEQTPAEVQSLYDTNVFGMLRICQAVVPSMRERGDGLVITMSSLGGLVAVPYMSAYTSAKFALEALSEALYHELRPHGVDVMILQPVAMHMDRPATGAHLRLVDGVGDDSPSHRVLDRMESDTEASRLTPEAVAKKVLALIRRRRRPLRVPMDRAVVLGMAKRVLPQAF